MIITHVQYFYIPRLTVAIVDVSLSGIVSQVVSVQ